MRTATDLSGHPILQFASTAANSGDEISGGDEERRRRSGSRQFLPQLWTVTSSCSLQPKRAFHELSEAHPRQHTSTVIPSSTTLSNIRRSVSASPRKSAKCLPTPAPTVPVNVSVPSLSIAAFTVAELASADVIKQVETEKINFPGAPPAMSSNFRTRPRQPRFNIHVCTLLVSIKLAKPFELPLTHSNRRHAG